MVGLALERKIGSAHIKKEKYDFVFPQPTKMFRPYMEQKEQEGNFFL
jgi:hypothetical protein